MKVNIRDDGIAMIVLDDPTAKVNTLNSSMMGVFENALNTIENDPRVKAAVIISGKPDNFVAGADIKMLSTAKNASELSEIAHGGQKLMDRLSKCKRPVVAAINGQALGGGLELAMAW